jgi:phytoene dehydrogenase-like protein
MSGQKKTADVIIVGAGLAGLSCAFHLRKGGMSALIVEASDGVGGRARTDRIDGFVLDRGFQVLQCAYPEAQRVLDYDALNLKPFYPGALVRFGGDFHLVGDPLRRPQDTIKTLRSPIGTIGDKMRMGHLRTRICVGSLDALLTRPETTTIQALHHAGFSAEMIARFFHPFFCGVFLAHDLHASSRVFEFVFRMFATGDTALPFEGMGAVSSQIASRLAAGSIRTDARVASVKPGTAVLTNGEEIRGRVVVIATEGPETARLLGEDTRNESRSVTCIYFSAAAAPIEKPILVLNGEGTGPINSLCVPSQVAPAYAPKGKSLVSVTVIGVNRDNDVALEERVHSQLREWFGPAADGWRHLKTYRISHALTDQAPPSFSPLDQPVRISPRLFVCGEHHSMPSIQWALYSGRRCAEAILKGFSDG